MINCMICNGQFDASPDSIVLCEYKAGFVHMGCCIDKCSMSRSPCVNAKAIYNKVK